MTRRWPRIVITVLFCLTFPTSAAAECAWVLWMSDPAIDKRQWGYAPGVGVIEFEPISPQVFDTRDECEVALRDIRKRELGAPLVTAGRRLPAKFTCLPDTVDPRGPKGK